MPLPPDELDRLADELSRVDVMCPVCDYNLRGVKHARCPECGRELTGEELREQRRVSGRHAERSLRTAIILGWMLSIVYLIQVFVSAPRAAAGAPFSARSLAALLIALCSVPLAIVFLPARKRTLAENERRNWVGAVLGWAAVIGAIMVSTVP